MLTPHLTFAAKVPKSGNSPDECEDQYAAGIEGWRFAVADGASDAIYASVWAAILADRFCDHPADAWAVHEFDRWVSLCRERWATWEGTLATKPLPWFTRDKLTVGSAAAFLGIVFSRLTDNDLAVHAVSYGDVCLFIVQDDILRLTFPLDTSDGFDNAPPLIRTLPSALSLSRFISSSVSDRDRIYLATDALAAWFLRTQEETGFPWRDLDALKSGEELSPLVDSLRASGRLRNDDVTFLRIECKRG